MTGACSTHVYQKFESMGQLRLFQAKGELDNCCVLLLLDMNDFHRSCLTKKQFWKVNLALTVKFLSRYQCSLAFVPQSRDKYTYAQKRCADGDPADKLFKNMST